MKKSLLFLFLLIFNQPIFSQNSTIKRFYEISFCGEPQTLKLIEYQNGKVEGYLKTELTEEKSNGEKLEIIKKINFNDTLTRKLLTNLKTEEIETLRRCEEDVECNNQVYLDGSYLSIKILSDEKDKKFEFWGIYPESQTNGKIEKIELRRKVQIMATIIDNEINLKKQFSETIKSLKTGKYCYWKGIAHTCIEYK
nr:hypothetical protein [uncultured Flavobacterium sp.]